MISKDSRKVLKWMHENDDWWYLHQITKACPGCDYRVMKVLQKNNFIDSAVFEGEPSYWDEYGEEYCDPHYRISDTGRAYLESMRSTWWKEFREWITLAIAVLALILSVISIGWQIYTWKAETSKSIQPTMPTQSTTAEADVPTLEPQISTIPQADQ